MGRWAPSLVLWDVDYETWLSTTIDVKISIRRGFEKERLEMSKDKMGSEPPHVGGQIYGGWTDDPKVLAKLKS